ncbi:MAG TPA: hypothetical protein VFQ45_14985 [Longimicrobium sp.]|nr:hypothetical protein [Longimicrobium sp.]
MNQAELLRTFANESYDDYVKHYLVKFWTDKAGANDWQSVVSAAFAGRHTVDGSVSENKAVDVARNRSGGGTRDFVSTLLSESLVRKAVKYIADNVIALHGKQRGAFTNYLVPVEGTMWTVQVKANEGFLPKQYRDSVVVGIDRNGLITHFHGDRTYAEGDIYQVERGVLKKVA